MKKTQKEQKTQRLLRLGTFALIVVLAAVALFLKSEPGQKLTGLKLRGLFSDAAPAKFRRSNAKKVVPQSYIVVLRDSTENPGAVADELSSKYRGKRQQVYESALKGFSVKMSETQAMKLSEENDVQFVEEDAYVEATAVQENAIWNLDRIDQRQYPFSTTYNYDSTGRGVHAYIIDSGIRVTHTDFGGRASVAADFVGDGQNGNDCYFHGTHVAGTVGSTTYGVAKDVTLHALRVLDCAGQGQVSWMIAAMNWLTANAQKPAVANISIILSGGSLSLDNALNNSIASGVTYAVAAGNFGYDACNYSPARVPNAITVGAIVYYNNPDGSLVDVKPGYSDVGACLDIFAPGQSILSLSNADDNSTRYLNGTSMASPHVAGVAALYLETHPDASPAEVALSIVNSGTKNAISTTLGNLGTGSPNNILYSYVTQSIPQTPTNPPPPPPPPPVSCSGTIYNGTITPGVISYHILSGLSGRAGVYSGVLSGTSATPQLTLEQKKGKGWVTVASSLGSLNYNGSRGTYRWLVSGSTSTPYSLCSKLP